MRVIYCTPCRDTIGDKVKATHRSTTPRRIGFCGICATYYCNDFNLKPIKKEKSNGYKVQQAKRR